MTDPAWGVSSRLGGLWRQADFLRLWLGETISLLGSRVTLLALPLTAILTLHATPVQMGILMAAETAPSLLIGLPAGAWVDRLRRRPLMISMDLGRAAVLVSIPISAWLGVLSLTQIAVAALLLGALSVVFDVAYRAYLPALVRPCQILEANARLEVSASTAQIAGPGIGGVLVQIFTAPVALLADALSFLGSALCLAVIRTAEPAPRRVPGSSLRREMAEGLRLVLGNPLLRSLTAASATFNLFDSVLFAVYVLYMTRTLGLAATSIGLVFGLAGIGGLLGALVVTPVTARLGLRRAVLLGILVATAGELSIAAAGGPQVVAVLVLLAAETAVELGATVFGVNALSLRQMATPEQLQGRVNATVRLAGQGIGPFGFLLGGALGAAFGLRTTVIVAGVGTLTSLFWMVRSG